MSESEDATSRRKWKAGGESRPETLSDEALEQVAGGGTARGGLPSAGSPDSILFFDEADALLTKPVDKTGC